MSRRLLGMSRPLGLWVVIAMAFAAGVLIERYQYLLLPDHAPPGVEQTFRPFWETWNLVNKYYVDHDAVKPERMTNGAIRGMLGTLGDPLHTGYLTKNEYELLESDLAGNFEGIGARMTMSTRGPMVAATLANSPASAAGLQAGDVLLEVDGKTVAGMPFEQVLNMVRGEPGTSVKLRVARQGRPEPLDFTIARAKVDVPSVTWRMLPGVPIAHIAIESFGRQVHSQLKGALAGARNQKAKALILDVRGNGGGLKDMAVAVSSEFLKDGNVLIERDAQDNRKQIPVRPGGTALDIPVSILIDNTTGSSAEIFAGALQDHGRGKLVGARTLGLGTVLEPFQLSDSSRVLLAVAEWLTPNGRQIWRHGITPDIPVSLPTGAAILLPETETALDAAALAKSADKQLLKAIEVLKEQIR